jgi:hypothetical protein
MLKVFRNIHYKTPIVREFNVCIILNKKNLIMLLLSQKQGLFHIGMHCICKIFMNKMGFSSYLFKEYSEIFGTTVKPVLTETCLKRIPE